MAVKKSKKNQKSKLKLKRATKPKPTPEAKPVVAVKKSKMAGLKKKSQQMIDDMLVKISPSLQGKIDHLVTVLGNSREGKLGDLSFLAGKIFLRAQDVSRGLKAMRNRKDEPK